MSERVHYVIEIILKRKIETKEKFFIALLVIQYSLDVFHFIVFIFNKDFWENN